MRTAVAAAANSRNGSTLIVVLILTLVATMMLASICLSTGTRMRHARVQVNMEQAFYLAEAGAERAVSHVAKQGQNATVGITVQTGTFGSGSYVAVIDVRGGSGEYDIDVAATGTVDGVSRAIKMVGVRRVSWARYALWYDREMVTPLWIVPGEKFDGPVYSRPQLAFHSRDLATKGQARFYDKAWSVASTIRKETSAVNPIFDKGLSTGVPVETMSSVDFNTLQSSANLVLLGETTMTLEGNKVKITNSRKGWNNYAYSVTENTMVYVKTATSGTAVRTANIKLSGSTGLDGRLTLVAENDILITGHVRYRDNPKTKPESTDALGLIAKRNIAVQTSAPNNLEIFAHMICQTGGFGVDSYDSGSQRGTLNVYGGIVNYQRNAVGTTGGTGYYKNYTFDRRFSKNPPPQYPVIKEEYEWIKWEG